jgi:hypothetical protein
VAAWLIGCRSQPIPEVDHELIAAGVMLGASEQAVRHGRELLVTSCRYCHVPVAPEAISVERWRAVLPRMIEKAQLGPVDEADIRAYVLAARAASRNK